MRQAVLVFSGYNIRAIIAFCRWANSVHLNFLIIAKDGSDPIFSTSYKDHVAITRDTPDLNSEEFCSWIDALSEQYSYERFIVLPSTEYLNRFLLDSRDDIERTNCVIPLTDAGLYARISDKKSFVELCDSYDLDIPDEYDQIPDFFPFVAKPRKYCSADGRQLAPHVIFSPADLDRFTRDESTNDYFFQQYVKGRSLYLLAYLPIHEEEVLFSQENLMQQSLGKSIILAKRADFHETDMAERYVKMLKESGFTGLIMIEVRYVENSGEYFVIEANPRLWGPMQLVVDNKVDLFGAMLRDYGFGVDAGGLSHDTPNEFYFWSSGMVPESLPIAFHNYSEEQFRKDLPTLIGQDIFSRDDTTNLFVSPLESVAPHER